MPFNTILSAPNLAHMRTEGHAIEAYMLLTPNDVVWQAEVDDTKANVNYASFAWATDTGTRTDVEVGQLLLVTASSTDFTNPVVTSVVRNAQPGATTVFLRETGQNIDNTMFVTVFDTYPLTEKLGRIDTEGTFKDYDQDYTDLPLMIGGLQSAYGALENAATFVQAFAPDITAVADGDALDTVLWDVGDGTITVGTSATQNITASFPNSAEHRWVSLTATGTNGVAQTFRFQVFTPDRFTSSDVIKLDYAPLSISGNIDNGWSGSVNAWANFDANDVLDNTRVAIFTREIYDTTGTPSTTPVQTNLVLVGELSAEAGSTAADAIYGALPDVNLTITGLGTKLTGLTSNKQNIKDVVIPEDWGDITDPTPTRVVMQHLAYDTTALTVLPVESADLSGYVFVGDALHLLGKTVGENVNRTLEAVNGQLVTAQDGTVGLYRNANYQSTSERNALDVIADFDYDEADYINIDALSTGYVQAAAQALAVGAVYNTTIDEITGVYEAKAPAASYGSGYTTADLPGQILVADLDDSDAEDEIKQRCSNHLAYVNDKWTFSPPMPSGNWPLVPSLHQWYTHTIPAAASPRARVFADTTRWILNEINLTFTGESVDVSPAWFVETESTGAGTVARKVPIVGETNLYLPPSSPFPSFPDDPLTLFPDDDPSYHGSFPFVGISQEEAASNYPPGHNEDAPINGEILNVSMLTGGTVSTTRDSVLNETYIVEVDGDGVVGYSGTWSETFDLTGAELPDYVTVSQGVFTPGTGVVYECITTPTYRNTARIVIDPSTTYTGTQLTQYYTHQLIGGDVGQEQAAIFQQGPIAPIKGWNYGQVQNGSQSLTYTGGAPWTITTGIETYNSSSIYNPCKGWGYLTKFVISGTGTNPFDPNVLRGDAFYEDYNVGEGTLYTGSNGLQVDAARPSGLPPYSGSHSYRFFVTGTGNAFDFKFLDSVYTDNSNNVLRVAITGPNMGMTA